MIRATELSGRAVVDIDAAEKIGTIDKMILDPDARRVAGFVVSRGGSRFTGQGKGHTLIPAPAVHAVGPDAVTVRQSVVGAGDISRLETLPRGSDIIGRKVVSEDGRFLGKVSDVLIDRATGRIGGYLLADHEPSRKFDEGAPAGKDAPYLDADSKLRAGRDLIVASEDAVNYDWLPEGPEADGTTPPGGWEAPPTAPPSGVSNSWVEPKT